MNRKRFIVALTSSVLGGSFLGYLGFRFIQLNTAVNLTNFEKSHALIAAIVDTIIPATDSPSASECGVPDFIIKMIKDCTPVLLQNKFLNGLEDLEKYTLATYEASFVHVTDVQRLEVLEYFEKKDSLMAGIVGKVQQKLLGKSFFTILKEHTAIGYFTSEGGATQALRYSHIPTKYIGCQPYLPGEKAWATY